MSAASQESNTPFEGQSTAGKTLPRYAWTLALFLVLGTFMLYWPVIHNGFVDYDDDTYVTSNRHVQQGLSLENLRWAFTHPVSGNWHPLTMMSHMLDCQLYGQWPGGHHLTSVFFHALNSALLFLFLFQLTRAPGRSFLVAALFAWHPLHVESVAWVAERKDVLSAFFGLLSLIFYVRHVRSQKSEPASAHSFAASFQSGFYWLSLLCFALGLMSKPMLVTWPFVMLLLDYWPLGRFQLNRLWPLLVEKIPFFLLVMAMCIVTFLVQSSAGATSFMATLTLGLRFENALISYCSYLSKIFWPHHLVVFYPYPAQWPLEYVTLSAAFLGTVTSILSAYRRHLPALFMGWLWFLGTLIPVIGLVQVGKQAMADRYAYLPSIGLFIAIVWGLYELARKWRPLMLSAPLGGVVVLSFCAPLTYQQLEYWQNSETLFRHALKITTDNEVARNNLGIALLNAGQTNAAMTEFQAAVSLSPRSFESHENIADILAKRGDIDAAFNEYQEAIRLKPGLPDAHNNLGILLALKGRLDAAASEYQEAVRLNPEFAEARFNLGKLLAQRGFINDAIVQFEAALEVTPGDAEIHFRLGNALAKTGRADDAIAHFQEAIRLKPDFAEARSNLGNLFSAKGRVDDAIAQFQEAVRLKPDFRDAHYNLGNAFLKQSQSDSAAAEYQEVIRLSPDFAPAHNYLGVCLLHKGRLDEAISQFQEALRLRPNYPEASANLAHVSELKNHPQ